MPDLSGRAFHPHAQRNLLLAIGVISAIALLALAAYGPIPQSAEYHRFADDRSLWRIPNAWNVLSNLPFLLFGAIGLRELHRGSLPGLLPELRAAYVIFFAAAALVALGSGYYHVQPHNDSLVWDRLPMTLAFMAFFCIVIGEHWSVRAARALLIPLLAVGVSSVAYWSFTEARGRGDLRPYAAVQFLPVLVIPLLLWCMPSAFDRTRHFWLLIASYALAKVFEHFDAEIYRSLRVVGGHALKHIAAANGVYCVVLALRQRRRVRG